MPDIIVYSGSFDPPHQGHLDCVRLAAKQFPKAKILVIPGKMPAGAQGDHKHPVASLKDRLALCKAEFAKIPNVEVSNLEESLPTPNYTVATLKFVEDAYPGQSLGLLLGQDQLAQFPKWHKPLEILRLATLLVVPRSGSGGAELNTVAKDVAAELALASPESRLILLEGSTSQAESRLLREHLSKNQPIPLRWLPEAGLRYIKDKNLYGKKA